MVNPAPPLHRYESVASTMDIAHQLAEEGAPSGTAVVAAEQTSGRGARGHTWLSPRGGLWLSVLLRPGRDGGDLLSLRAGLAVADAIEHAAPRARIAIKWPNDLMWGDRKVGGVLCEGRWTGAAPAWVAIGVGLNVRNPLPADVAAIAAAVGDSAGTVTPEGLLQLVLPAVRGIDLITGRLGPEELAALERRDWLRGRRVASPAIGLVAGVAPDGALVIRCDDGSLARCRGGAVELAGAAGRP